MCFGALIVNPVLDIAETILLSLLYLFSKGGKALPLFCNGIKYLMVLNIFMDACRLFLLITILLIYNIIIIIFIIVIIICFYICFFVIYWPIRKKVLKSIY